MSVPNLRTINLMPRDEKTLEDVTNTRTTQTHTTRDLGNVASKSGDDVKNTVSGKVELTDYVIHSLSKYGLCVVDNFLGEKRSV